MWVGCAIPAALGIFFNHWLVARLEKRLSLGRSLTDSKGMPITKQVTDG